MAKAGATTGDGGDTTKLHYSYSGGSERWQLWEKRGVDDEPSSTKELFTSIMRVEATIVQVPNNDVILTHSNYMYIIYE
ncbi:hypothetical protein MTR_1g016335 [Medicago truncatula]|uniref:Uncharacterized protein n=1 Tax=Medicago truncatula TaxID=3880 RepID=A0A072VET4_MEDTR|nr:hypothetical protein MTR_1g016335 [Medicago truncatula]